MSLRALKGGRLLLPDGVLEGHTLLFDSSIQALVPEEQLHLWEVDELWDARGAWVAPGFINIHVHGGMGADVMDSTAEALETIGTFLQSTGVTSYLPTTLTAPTHEVERALDSVRLFQTQKRGAEILGVHLEGPYLSAPFKGAHDQRFIALPDSEWVQKNRDILKIVTFAPDKDTSGEFTQTLNQHGIIPSLGHSGADCECALKAVHNGAKSFTHLFNAMSPLHHREPGMVGAAFDSDAYVELITDNIHVSPKLYEVVCRVKGCERVILVTDSMRAAGLPDGAYELGGLPVTVSGGAARLTDSGVLAGSVLRMHEGVRNMAHATGRPLWEVVRMATANPARLLQLQEKKGVLAEKADADFVLLNDQLDVIQTVQGGQTVFEKR